MEGAVKCEHLGALGQRGALCTLSGAPRPESPRFLEMAAQSLSR